MNLLEAHIEEFEQGTWVADLVTDAAFTGMFQLPDGSTWIGKAVSQREDRSLHFTKVVGGQAGLGKVVGDTFYQGQISLQIAVTALCKSIGETPGAIAPGVFLTQYQQLIDIGSQALDAMAKAAGGAVSPGAEPLLWWIDRTGLLQMKLPDPLYRSRSQAGPASGIQDMETVDVDGSVELVTPNGAVLGATYGTPPQAVRHIRWKLTQDRFTARLFFFPFIFRPPTQRKYDATHNAKVTKDNGDGTVDVYVYRSPSDGKSPAFGVQQVRLFCGVPHSKAKCDAGDEVTFGWFGGDPQKPYAVAMAQDTTATKKVARSTDPVKVTIPAMSFLVSCSGSPAVGVLNPNPVDVTGTITDGSERLKVGD